MSRPVYWREDFEPQASTPLLFFIGCVLACCAFAIGAMAGFEFRDALAREQEKQKPLQARKSAQNPPVSLIPCDQAGRLEHDRICRARFRSTQIGAVK